jgi:hypothetical protein
LAQQSGNKITFRRDLLAIWGKNHDQDVSNFFNIEIEKSATQSDLRKKYLQALRRTRWLLPFLNALRINRTYLSYETGFDPNLARVRAGMDIFGYFQSYKYFYELRDKPKPLLASCLQILGEAELENVDLENSIALHIRRGDYVAHKETYGLLSTEYYESALAAMDVNKELVLIFSDDIEEAKIVLENSRYFEQMIFVPEISTISAFSLISGCGAIIISNSTFSYWAAMFSKEFTRVISPEKWYRSMEDPRELLPPNWLRIASSWEI